MFSLIRTINECTTRLKQCNHYETCVFFTNNDKLFTKHFSVTRTDEDQTMTSADAVAGTSYKKRGDAMVRHHGVAGRPDQHATQHPQDAQRRARAFLRLRQRKRHPSTM